MSYCVLNLEEGFPAIWQALLRLENEIATQKRLRRNNVIKIIHGYGSSGMGGAIKRAMQIKLAELKAQRNIKDFLAGENWEMFNEKARYINSICPGLSLDKDYNAYNAGITVVLLFEC